MPQHDTNRAYWEYRINTALKEAGYTSCIVKTKYDAEGKVIAEADDDGRTAHGAS